MIQSMNDMIKWPQRLKNSEFYYYIKQEPQWNSQIYKGNYILFWETLTFEVQEIMQETPAAILDGMATKCSKYQKVN